LYGEKHAAWIGARDSMRRLLFTDADAVHAPDSSAKLGDCRDNGVGAGFVFAGGR